MKTMICPACKKEFTERIAFCSRCNFPFNGSEKEKGIHIGQFIEKKGVITDSSVSLDKSQKILYVIGGIKTVMLVLSIMYNNLTSVDVILNAIIAITFLACGFYLKKNPILLTIIPLLLIIFIHLLNYLINPNSFANGLLIKIMIVGSLVYSLYLLKSAEKFKKDYDIES